MAIYSECLSLILVLPVFIAAIGFCVDVFSNDIHRHMKQIKRINQTGAYIGMSYYIGPDDVYTREYLIVDNNFSDYGYDCMTQKSSEQLYRESLWIEVQYNYEILSKSMVFAGCSSGVRTPLGVLNQKIVMHALAIGLIEGIMLIALVALIFISETYQFLDVLEILQI